MPTDVVDANAEVLTGGGEMTGKEAKGNWYKVFQMIDVDGSGKLGYEELEEVIRAEYPGLGIASSTMSTTNIRGLWKAIDADRSGDVTVDEFMSFMREDRGPWCVMAAHVCVL